MKYKISVILPDLKRVDASSLDLIAEGIAETVNMAKRLSPDMQPSFAGRMYGFDFQAELIEGPE